MLSRGTEVANRTNLVRRMSPKLAPKRRLAAASIGLRDRIRGQSRHRSGYSRLMGADEAQKGTKPSKHRHAVAAAAGYRSLMNRI
jgi:hypothetical protein